MAYKLDGTKFKAWTDAGAPLVGGRLFTYVSGTTTPKATYTDSTLGSANTNPIILDARGEADVWLGSGAYTFLLQTSAGVTVDTVDGVQRPEDAVNALISDLASTAAGKGADLLKTLRSIAGASETTVGDWIDRQRLDTYADFGIAPDGTTDRTTVLNALTSALGGAGFRGWIHIPYGTKFNVASVYAALPTGIILDDESSINWGQPPSYKNRFRIMFSGDLVADDTQQIIGSGHHPALMLLNMGTAPSVAASSRYGTLLHGVGKNVDGDPMLGWLMQFAKHPSLNRWRTSFRLQTKYDVAIGNPTYWAALQVVPAGAYRLSDGGKVYKTTAGGTCGSTAPTGTGSGISDGGVTWDYVQAAINTDSTAFDFDEDGNAGFYGPSSLRLTLTGGASSTYIEVDPASGDVVWRDVARSLDIWRSSTAQGVRAGRIQSYARTSTTVSSSGAIQLVTALHYLSASGGPWDITDITLPTGQTSGEVTLWFAGAGLTIKNNANIVTRTGADIPSAQHMMVTLYKDPAITSAWIVKSKN